MSEQWEWRVERLDCEFDELCERMRDFDVAMERMDRALLQLRDDLSAVQAGLQRVERNLASVAGALADAIGRPADESR
jgi:hypothetical protein